MKYIPRHNCVLVRPDEAKTETESGLLLTDIQKPTTGIIIVGNSEIKEGQRVLFSKYGYDEAVVENEVLYIVSDANVKMIIEWQTKFTKIYFHT